MASIVKFGGSAGNDAYIELDTTGTFTVSDGTDSTSISPPTPATAAGAGVTAATGTLPVQQVVLTLASTPLPLTDEAGVVAYTGLKVADMPEGSITILGATGDLALTKSSAGVNDTWNGDWSLGTATASNNNTLSSTEANIIPSTATPTAVSGATTATGRSTADVHLDGTTTPVDIFLNFLVDDADHDVTSTPCNLIASGTITITYVNHGDY